MNGLKKSSKTDISVTTAHVEKESISSTLEMLVYFSQIAPLLLLEVAMVLDFGLIIPLLFFCFTTMCISRYYVV